MTQGYVENKDIMGSRLVELLEKVHESKSVKGKKIKRFYLGEEPYFIVEYIGDFKTMPKQKWERRGGKPYGTMECDFTK